jgi:hypothetical protein
MVSRKYKEEKKKLRKEMVQEDESRNTAGRPNHESTRLRILRGQMIKRASTDGKTNINRTVGTSEKTKGNFRQQEIVARYIRLCSTTPINN